MIFKLIGAPHVQDGRTYRKGDHIETDRDLRTVFKGKFVLVSGEDLVAIAQPVIPKKAETKSEDAPLVPPVKKMASGVNMTITFTDTKDTGLDVMKIAEDQFQIAEKGFLFTDGIFTRAEMIIFLKNHNA